MWKTRFHKIHWFPKTQVTLYIWKHICLTSAPHKADYKKQYISQSKFFSNQLALKHIQMTIDHTFSISCWNTSSCITSCDSSFKFATEKIGNCWIWSAVSWIHVGCSCCSFSCISKFPYCCSRGTPSDCSWTQISASEPWGFVSRKWNTSLPC